MNRNYRWWLLISYWPLSVSQVPKQPRPLLIDFCETFKRFLERWNYWISWKASKLLCLWFAARRIIKSREFWSGYLGIGGRHDEYRQKFANLANFGSKRANFGLVLQPTSARNKQQGDRGKWVRNFERFFSSKREVIKEYLRVFGACHGLCYNRQCSGEQSISDIKKG